MYVTESFRSCFEPSLGIQLFCFDCHILYKIIMEFTYILSFIFNKVCEKVVASPWYCLLSKISLNRHLWYFIDNYKYSSFSVTIGTHIHERQMLIVQYHEMKCSTLLLYWVLTPVIANVFINNNIHLTFGIWNSQFFNSNSAITDDWNSAHHILRLRYTQCYLSGFLETISCSFSDSPLDGVVIPVYLNSHNIIYHKYRVNQLP